MRFFKLVFIILIGAFSKSCASYQNASVISQMTTINTALLKTEVAQYFCHNLTEYFNTYEYYKINSEVYTEKEKQNNNGTTRITMARNIYNVEYEGSAGRYIVSFSNKEFSESEQIFTFGSLTVLGNAIWGKVYDTFLAWVSREEIALKDNSNSDFFRGEINAAVEIEKWYNSLSTTNN